MHPQTLKHDRSVDGIWLTDPTVPKAKPVWATRRSIFRDKRAPAWIPEEDTMWWDARNDVVYVASYNEITDFASTPAGDGHEGVLRGGGRLHDLMDDNTEVLIPRSSISKGILLQAIHMSRNENKPLTRKVVQDFCGYAQATRDIGIWQAGRLYSRMLRSAGFPTWRALLQRTGLRTLGLQHLYKRVWLQEGWEYAGDRTDV